MKDSYVYFLLKIFPMAILSFVFNYITNILPGLITTRSPYCKLTSLPCKEVCQSFPGDSSMVDTCWEILQSLSIPVHPSLLMLTSVMIFEDDFQTKLIIKLDKCPFSYGKIIPIYSKWKPGLPIAKIWRVRKTLSVTASWWKQIQPHYSYKSIRCKKQ